MGPCTFPLDPGLVPFYSSHRISELRSQREGTFIGFNLSHTTTITLLLFLPIKERKLIVTPANKEYKNDLKSQR